MFKVCAIFYLLINVAISIEVIPLSSTLWNHPYSPFYDIPRNSLYFTELTTGLIHRFDLNENVTYSTKIENIAPSFIIPVKGSENKFIISDVLKVKTIEWDGLNGTAQVIDDAFGLDATKYASTNWNTAKISPKCEFYGGSFRKAMCSCKPNKNAALFQHTRSNKTKPLLKHLKISGDFEWNIKKNLFYHLDSCKSELNEYKWNAHSGKLHHGRTVFKFNNNGDKENVPLGLTIDRKGYVYVTKYLGGEVLQINPRTSKVVRTIEIPAQAVAAVTFGGPNLDILFVTTDQDAFDVSSGGVTTETLSPFSGSIFMVKGLNARGFPARKFCPNC